MQRGTVVINNGLTRTPCIIHDLHANQKLLTGRPSVSTNLTQGVLSQHKPRRDLLATQSVPCTDTSTRPSKSKTVCMTQQILGSVDEITTAPSPHACTHATISTDDNVYRSKKLYIYHVYLHKNAPISIKHPCTKPCMIITNKLTVLYQTRENFSIRTRSKIG